MRAMAVAAAEWHSSGWGSGLASIPPTGKGPTRWWWCGCCGRIVVGRHTLALGIVSPARLLCSGCCCCCCCCCCLRGVGLAAGRRPDGCRSGARGGGLLVDYTRGCSMSCRPSVDIDVQEAHEPAYIPRCDALHCGVFPLLLARGRRCQRPGKSVNENALIVVAGNSFL